MTDEQSQDSAGQEAELSLRDELAEQLAATTNPEPAPETEDATVEASVGDESEEISEPEPDEGVDEPETLKAPENWASEDKEAFSSLDRAGQEFLLKRHKEMESGLSEKLQEVAGLRKAIEPFNPVFQQTGSTPEQAIPWLLNQWIALQNNPEAGLQNLARQLGVELPQPSTSDDSDDYVDPQVSALKSEIAELRKELGGVKTQHEQASAGNVQAQIDAFKNEKDADGKPLRPYFDEIAPLMGNLINSGIAKGLEDAYERAVQTLPSYVEERISAERKKLEDEVKAKQQERVKKAKKSAPKVTGGDVVDAKSKSDSWRDELREQVTAALNS